MLLCILLGLMVIRLLGFVLMRLCLLVDCCVLCLMRLMLNCLCVWWLKVWVELVVIVLILVMLLCRIWKLGLVFIVVLIVVC